MSTSSRKPPDGPPHRHDSNWESRALRQVAARVEDLPAVPDEADDFGWEESVLRRLRQRLSDSG